MRTEINQALQKRLYDELIDGKYLDVTVSFENVGKFKPDVTAPFIHCYDVPAGSDVVELGGRQEFTGLFQIDIAYVVGGGTNKMLDMADSLADLYAIGSELTFNGFCVKITGNSISPIRANAPWAVLSLSIVYSSYN